MSVLQEQKELIKIEIDKAKLDDFSENLLDGMNYKNCAIAGGSINKLYLNLDTSHKLFKHSDIDIYLYGEKEDKIKTLKYLLKFFKYTVLIPYNNVLTMYFRGKTRHIQIICTDAKTKYNIVSNFDFSHLEMMYDGTDFLATKWCLDNLKTNSTTFKEFSKSSNFRLYKTLLLNLKIKNYKYDKKENNYHTEQKLFDAVLGNKEYEQELTHFYYPKFNEDLNKIIDDLENIYINKYNIHNYTFRNIINNLDLINSINWGINFSKVMNKDYKTLTDCYIYRNLNNKIRHFIRTNDVKNLQKLGRKIINSDMVQYFYDYVIEIFFKESLLNNNIAIMFQIYYIFKNRLIYNFKEKPQIYINDFKHNLVHKSNNIKEIHEKLSFCTLIFENIYGKKRFKKNKFMDNTENEYKEYIYLKIFESGNFKLFNEFNKILPYEIVDEDSYFLKYNIYNLISSGNIEFIKYIYNKYLYNKSILNLQRLLFNINHFDVLMFFIQEFPELKKVIFKKEHYIYFIKKKDKQINEYLLSNINKCTFNKSDIFGYLCYTGDIKIIQSVYESETINISNHFEGAYRYACMSGNLELVKYLYKLKPTINLSYDYNTGIKDASISGNKDLVEFILQEISKKTGETFSDIIKSENIGLYSIPRWGNGNRNLTPSEARSLKVEANIFKILDSGIDYLAKNHTSILGLSFYSGNLRLIQYLAELENIDTNKILEKHLYKEYTSIIIIQNWWKNIYYDIHTKVGKKKINRDYILSITND